AEGNVQIGITAGVDVATFEKQEHSRNPNGPVATAVWAPPKPHIAVAVDLASLETFELCIYDEERARTLVAAAEIVSPRNKDRPEARRAFLDKCAAYLREGVSVVIVDIVTSRQHNFHAELMELLKAGDAAASAINTDLYAVAYRVHLVGKQTELEGW